MAVEVDKEKCISCAGCISVCPVTALVFDVEAKNPKCDEKKCINCKNCIRFCPVGALRLKK